MLTDTLTRYALQPLRRAGGSTVEAKRLAYAIKEWRDTLFQPPPPWLRQLADAHANQDGVYANAADLMRINAVPRPGACMRYRRLTTQLAYAHRLFVVVSMQKKAPLAGP